MTTNLSDLVVAKTATDELDTLVASLQRYGFPATSWADGSVPKTLLRIDAEALAELSSVIASIAAGGYLDTAAGAWLTLLAKQAFNLDRRAAISTRGTVRLTAASSAGPYTIVPGQLWFATASGKRFSNVTGGTLATGGTLSLEVVAESAGAAFNVASDTITQLVTSLAGVTCTNPRFTTVDHVGSGSGTVTPSGTPTLHASIVLRIQSAGGIGVGTFQYSLDGGVSYNGTDLPISSTFAIPGTGVTTAFAGTFAASDTYAFRASWITTTGADEESDVALVQRCRDRWGTLGTGATEAAYRSWAFAASSQVTRVTVTATSTTGQVRVLVAGGGVLSGDVLGAVSAYIDERRPLCVQVSVESPTERPIAVSGVVFVKGASLASAQAAALANLDALTAGLAIGGAQLNESPSHGVAVASILEQLMLPDGVLNVGNLHLNGASADVVMAPTELAVLNTSGLVFRGV